MSTHPFEQTWTFLLRRSAPTFQGETQVPYGLTTATLAALRAERTSQRAVERIGWRALMVSMGALGVAAAVTVSLDLRDPGLDSDPNLRAVVQAENLPIS